MLNNEASCDITPRSSAGSLAERREQWRGARSRIQAQLGEEIFDAWFKGVELDACEPGGIRLSVATRFLQSWIKRYYLADLMSAWHDEDPDVLRVEIVVRNGLHTRAPEQTELGRNHLSPPSPARPSTVSATAAYYFLNPRLTFNTFAVGPANAVAHAAARQITSPPLQMNPLYLHGHPGVGKTHLLQAIAWHALSCSKEFVYLTAERLSFQCLPSGRSIAEFRATIRDVDIVLLDDIQFLRGKTAVGEIDYLLDTRIGEGKQVVAVADGVPHDLECLGDRVRSRLAGGLVISLGLDVETIRSITVARLKDRSFTLSDGAIDFIANSAQDGRAVDGFLNRIAAMSYGMDGVVGRDLAEMWTRDLILPAEPRKVKIEEIQRVVARRYNVSRGDLMSARRTANVVRPRQIACWLTKTMTLRSFPEIGRRFGGRDHTTILSSVRKIDRLMDSDPALAIEVDALRKEILEEQT